MRSFGITRRPRPGGLVDALQTMEIDVPQPGDRDAVVRVIASTINIDDIHVAEGTFYGGIPLGARPGPERPVIPGSDVAGIVTRVGKGVRSFRIGDAVFGLKPPLSARGTWAEVCAVDERWLTKKPENISFEEAAACGVAGLVALAAVQSARIQSGMVAVVVGATGGIGSMEVQLAVRAGAMVVGVCGTAHLERARQLGCSIVLDYRDGPWDESLKAQGITCVHRVLDTVGGLDVEAAASRVLRRDGMFVTVVGPERFIGDRPLGWTGILSTLGRIAWRMLRWRISGPHYVLTGPTAGGGRMLPEVAAAASQGILPPIDSVVRFELEAMRNALRRAVAHKNSGRIVLRVESSRA
jgi:alcohol dehydrogenase